MYCKDEKYRLFYQVHTFISVLLNFMTKRAYACGIGPAFEVVGGKWKAIILWELEGGPLRFGELRRRVTGASEKMLIQQLRELETRRFHHPPGLPGGAAARGICFVGLGRPPERGAVIARRLG
jgi:hypothetical protein